MVALWTPSEEASVKQGGVPRDEEEGCAQATAATARSDTRAASKQTPHHDVRAQRGGEGASTSQPCIHTEPRCYEHRTMRVYTAANVTHTAPIVHRAEWCPQLPPPPPIICRKANRERASSSYTPVSPS
ncbi:hypothetical protein MTO96_018089 [Rhipicephalus appendiculatus]